MRYRENRNPEFHNVCSIRRIGDDGSNWDIPIAEDNTDYQKYLTWLEGGNTPEPAEG